MDARDRVKPVSTGGATYEPAVLGAEGDYPVYCCRVDRDQHAGIRALRVDAIVERVLRDALAPDQIAIALHSWPT